MNERQKWAVYENEDNTDGKRVPLMNPRFYRLRRGRRGRRERLKSDRVVRKRPLKFRLLRKKSNEIRMNRVSWIGAVAPSHFVSVRNEQPSGWFARSEKQITGNRLRGNRTASCCSC